MKLNLYQKFLKIKKIKHFMTKLKLTKNGLIIISEEAIAGYIEEQVSSARKLGDKGSLLEELKRIERENPDLYEYIERRSGIKALVHRNIHLIGGWKDGATSTYGIFRFQAIINGQPLFKITKEAIDNSTLADLIEIRSSTIEDFYMRETKKIHNSNPVLMNHIMNYNYKDGESIHKGFGMASLEGAITMHSIYESQARTNLTQSN